MIVDDENLHAASISPIAPPPAYFRTSTEARARGHTGSVKIPLPPKMCALQAVAACRPY
jgi:hypothetical protein